MLPSQASRATGWRSSSRTGGTASAALLTKGNLVPRLMLVAGAAVAIIVAVTLWSRLASPGAGQPQVEDLAAQRAQTPPPGAAAPTAKPPIVAPGPAVREPMALEMGRPGGAPADRFALIPPPAGAAQPAGPVSNPQPGAPSSGPGPVQAPAGDPSPDTFKEVRDTVDAANRALAAGRQVEARTLLNSALMNGALPASERAALRQQIQNIQETLLFGPRVAQGDPFTDWYTVQPGDSLVKIMQRQSLPPDWRLLQRINRMARPGDLHAGQRLKVVRTPFHAIVHKNDYRMDIYVGDPLPPGVSNGTRVGPDGQEEGWTFVRSFRVGLGESNGTPTGTFTVRPRSKMVNPRWVNPRTGQKFEADDPKNPIGEHWIGLDGADDATRKFTGYGIHGTIELDSIGQQRSMGCVRMLPDDVAFVYELLSERLSSVKILP
ncbi:MAG: L,D-transpeptidase family protein [Phycisphaerae bacterium]|nr:L,D-transpeptidase family protein [Phycisphaerae bacterium]